MSNLPQHNLFDDIQRLCRDYRRQLRGGADVRLQDYLDRVDADSREMLFQNLLHIDIEFRRRSGKEQTSDEYIADFPQYARLIRQAFFESTVLSADPSLDTPAERPTAQFPDVPAGRRLGDYELLRQIGRGAFGAVYKAKHLHRGDIVALKLLPRPVDGGADSSRDADRLHRFRREFRALCEVNHPHLVGMQSLEVDGSQWFFTMDLIEGTDFLDFVRPGGQLDLPRLRTAGRQLAEGIAALHRQHIVHRDLKPGNVMVDRNGRVVILDFGLVVEERQQADFTVVMTRYGFAGTPLYAAPEQLLGDSNAASDWYAVGVMLYEALLGTPPFRGSGAELLQVKSSTDAPSLVGEPGVPDDLGELVDSLLRRDPVQRPDDATVLRSLGATPDSDSRDSNDSSSDSVESSSRRALIGREAELKTLQSLYQRLMNDRQSQAVFIHGLSGEGKTSLVDEFLSSIRTDNRSLVLSGRCYDRESVPFKAIDSLMDSLVLFLRGRSEAEVRSWLPDEIELLARLFPMLRRVTPIGELIPSRRETQDTRQLRHRAFAALRDLLAAISASTPIILFIDDLQWGDGDSATAMRDVLQPPDAPAVMLLGTYRSDEAAESPFLKEWADYRGVTELELSQHTIEIGPLSEEQCLNLLAVRFGSDPVSVRQQAHVLFEGTRGNPYFLDQLLEGSDPQSGTVTAVPLSELIDRRLQRLPTTAGPLLKVIAVAGQALTLSEAAAVADQATVAMSTVTHMRNERLVRLIGSGDDATVDTYHDKIRETVLVGLPDTEQRELHLRFAEFLLAETPDNAGTDDETRQTHGRVYDLAFHLMEAGDQRAFAYQLAAGVAALREYAMETSLEYLSNAHDLLPAGADASTRFRLFFSLAEACQGLDRLQEARGYYERALPVAPSELAAARCEYGVSKGLARMGEVLEAQRYANLAFSRFGEAVPQTQIGQLLGLMRSFFEFHVIPAPILRKYRKWGSDPNAEAFLAYAFSSCHYAFLTSSLMQLTVMVRTSAIAKRSSQSVARSLNISQYAGMYSGMGFPRLGRHYLRIADRSNDESASPLAQSLIAHNVGANLFFLGQLDEAEAVLNDGLPNLQRTRHYSAGMSLHWLRHIASVRGNADVIERIATEELRFGEATNETSTIAYSRYGLADALSRKGEFVQAIQLGKLALKGLQSTGLTTAQIARQELGRAQLQGSDYDGAEATLEQNCHIVLNGLMYLEVYLDSFSLYVEALLGPTWSGRHHSQPVAKKRLTRRWARIARWFCGRFPTLRPHAYRVSGRTAFADARRRKAKRYFDEAVRSAEKVGAEYELARALIDRSWLGLPDADADRERGLALLQELNCVLPEAEVKQLEDSSRVGNS